MAQQSPDIAKSMFQSLMRGDWDAVVKDYKEERAQMAKITRTDDTVLHVAISSGSKEDAVKLVNRLVKLVQKKEVLKMMNDKGNNPLHLAAGLGIVEMCDTIVERHPQLSGDSPLEDLIGARNDKGETPLFIAALRGNKKAFFYLHSKTKDKKDKGITLCRRNDGDTILHCAISGEYFDLAYHIIHLYQDLANKYQDLANKINQKGYLPLHILANRPSAFKSGSRLGRVDHVLYSCIWVEQLKEDSHFENRPLEQTKERNPKFIPVPDNYAACFDFFSLSGKVKKIAANSFKIRSLDHRFKKESGPSMQEFTTMGVGIEENQFFPPNYTTIFDFMKLLIMVLIIPFGLGIGRIQRLKVQKQKHTWAYQVMELLISHASAWQYDSTGKNPFSGESGDTGDTPMTMTIASDGMSLLEEASPSRSEITDTQENNKIPNNIQPNPYPNEEEIEATKETAVLVAARMGVVEMVEKILETFPIAIQDTDQDNKNIVLLAVENRQPQVYQCLLKKNIMTETVFQEVDNKGNGALHLAATLGTNRPWLIPGAALQMQWEIKWFKFVMLSMPRLFFPGFNEEGLTPMEVFTETHKGLVKDGGKWLTNTSQSCSVVAALIATVAFATATTVPGGVKKGHPILENQSPFEVFAISSLVALSFSVTAMVMFLAILTSRYEEKDFEMDLPLKLILGLSSLFVSIAAILLSFCAGHFFVLNEKVRYAAYPVYAVTCLPVTFFALAQFPLYVDLIRSTLVKVPRPTHKMLSF